MREPTVADVMNRQVITAVPGTPFKQLVGIMLAHDLREIPIIDATGKPIGVVTEADALSKLEFHGGTDYPSLLSGSRCRARWRKSAAVLTVDLMTAPAVMITASAPLSDGIHALNTHRLRQLCVVDDACTLTGTFNHHDALRLMLRGDALILTDIERSMPTSARGTVTVRVTAGEVTLDGTLPLRSTVERAVYIAHRVPGVIAVHDNLYYDVDDLIITGP